jgi:murein DD-endopeptidase MepM/ murein hydrolase activator NlpD
LQKVRVTTRREGDTVHFYVQNDELCEVTMTFEMELLNLKASAVFPYTASFAAGKVTEAFTLSPGGPGEKWGYSYTNYYKLGSCTAKHEDSCLYELPYGSGSTFHVTQAYGGSFSHKGSNRYAIDWKMPEGTLVRAARGGVVVKTKDDSNKGGSSIKYDRYNNYVLIRHEDGTLGHYCHLQKGGCLVKPGQKVRTGDILAHSGNTGFSSGPHLHFCVFKTVDGRERESLPIKFRTAEAEGITLVEGGNYKAGVIGSLSAQATATRTTAQGGAVQ